MTEAQIRILRSAIEETIVYLIETKPGTTRAAKLIETLEAALEATDEE